MVAHLIQFGSFVHSSTQMQRSHNFLGRSGDLTYVPSLASVAEPVRRLHSSRNYCQVWQHGPTPRSEQSWCPQLVFI
jgi:hypothetical protein